MNTPQQRKLSCKNSNGNIKGVKKSKFKFTCFSSNERSFIRQKVYVLDAKKIFFFR